MKKYVKTNIFPIIVEVIFIISCFIVPREYYIYTNFCFYLILAIYFGCRKDFSIKEWLHSLKSGKKFWKHVILTALQFCVAHAKRHVDIIGHTLMAMP